MNRKPKDILALVFSTSLCVYAVWQGLQLVSIAGFLGVLAVIYKPSVVRVSEILIDLLGRTTMAKYGGLEVQVGTEALGASFAEGAPLWMRDILAAASASHVGLIVAISTSGRLAVTNGVLKRLRQLRDFGLLEHDGDGVSSSSWVWLSPAGRQVAAHLLHHQVPPAYVPPAEAGASRIVSASPSHQPLQPTSDAASSGGFEVT